MVLNAIFNEISAISWQPNQILRASVINEKYKTD